MKHYSMLGQQMQKHFKGKVTVVVKELAGIIISSLLCDGWVFI